ncbi:MAG: putative DNA modification/repair radical SAM protein [Lachnospiraceae bacterium]|nr:putative DNA modification/repair radical SAM protein [Lachnospiraceae bacterium]
MNNTIINEKLSLSQKLEILSDAAKYDVACTSSGVERKGDGKNMGNSAACGICHSFAADGRCISLLKILMSNECIYDCKYCVNRSSNDVVRATFTPDEICKLTYEFYRRNYIEGLFLSSGIIDSPDNTMKLLYETLYKLRNVYKFNGYIHVKGIPGADPVLVEMIGYLADRMSINLELPTGDGLKKLAPHKNRKNILTPMKNIQYGISTGRGILGIEDKYKRIDEVAVKDTDIVGVKRAGRYFVPAGQSTQMIIGATDESDYHIVTIAENLYKKFDLKRVFYSGYVPINEDKDLPALGTPVPLLREHRLYQADWLLRFYDFSAGELLSENHPNLNTDIDPKCDWAVNHLEEFPMEINYVSYQKLLRIPGIGVKSARRIVSARRYGRLDFEDLKKMGVVLKRAVYFITCNGRMMYNTRMETDYITRQLTYSDKESMKAGTDIYVQMQLPIY